MPAPVKRAKRKDGLKRQAELMAAALELFAAQGYAATSIDDIIAKAGTARGTFYLHFTGKPDLFAMIVDEYLSQLDAIVETLDISMDKPVDELKAFYRDALHFFAGLPAVKPFVKLMLRDAQAAQAGTLERVLAFEEKVVQLSARYIAQAQRAKRVVPGLEPVALSVCIVGAVKELLLRWTADETFDLDAAADTVIEVYFRGMLA